MSQLFVGNLSRNVSFEDLKHAFESMGPCKVVVKVSVLLIPFISQSVHVKERVIGLRIYKVAEVFDDNRFECYEKIDERNFL